MLHNGNLRRTCLALAISAMAICILYQILPNKYTSDRAMAQSTLQMVTYSSSLRPTTSNCLTPGACSPKKAGAQVGNSLALRNRSLQKSDNTTADEPETEVGVNVPYRYFPKELKKFIVEAGAAKPMTSILVSDVALLKCLLNATNCPDFSSASNVTLWCIQDQVTCSNEIAPLVHDRTIDMINNVTVLQKNQFTIYIVPVEQRRLYWYIPAYGNADASAFSPFNISIVLINNVPFNIPTNISHYLIWAQRSLFMECNRTLADDLKEEYKEYQNGPAIKPDQFDQLVYFRDLLYSLDLTPILIFGTALGWYRHCDVIPDTTDLDMAIPAEQYSKHLESVLIADPRLLLYWILGKPSDSLELSVMAHSIKIDLFFLYPENDAVWAGGMIVPKKKKVRWIMPKIEVLCSCDIRGNLFLIPCNVYDFNVANYGPKWYIPVRDKHFTFWKSAYNMQENGFWTASDWKSVYRTVFSGQ